MTASCLLARRGPQTHNRDAWYGGYTGNFVAAVWFGNDNYESTRRMTGGSLPAMAWREIMSFAHLDVELAPDPGARRGRGNRLVAQAPAAEQNPPPRARNTSLSRRSFEVVGGINRMFESAQRGRGGLSGRAPRQSSWQSSSGSSRGMVGGFEIVSGR